LWISLEVQNIQYLLKLRPKFAKMVNKSQKNVKANVASHSSCKFDRHENFEPCPKFWEMRAGVKTLQKDESLNRILY